MQNSMTNTMLSAPSPRYVLNLILIFCFVFICLTIDLNQLNQVQANPTNSVDYFSAGLNMDPSSSAANHLDGQKSQESSAASFRKFVNSNPDSTIIGELKPNASALEMMILRNKIANTILRMQELDKQTQIAPLIETNIVGECFIEVTTVEKVPGKCHRSNNGLPICQSSSYMSISNECS